MTNQESFGELRWWIEVVQYYQLSEGRRWTLCYDDTDIADFDHFPTMKECMEALITWWNR